MDIKQFCVLALDLSVRKEGTSVTYGTDTLPLFTSEDWDTFVTEAPIVRDSPACTILGIRNRTLRRVVCPVFTCVAAINSREDFLRARVIANTCTDPAWRAFLHKHITEREAD